MVCTPAILLRLESALNPSSLDSQRDILHDSSLLYPAYARDSSSSYNLLPLRAGPCFWKLQLLAGVLFQANGPPKPWHHQLPDFRHHCHLDAAVSVPCPPAPNPPQMLASAWWETVCYTSLCWWSLPHETNSSDPVKLPTPVLSFNTSSLVPAASS